jgi:hypothetical protein
MNENVFAAVLWLNEAVALVHIERFDEALWLGSPQGYIDANKDFSRSPKAALTLGAVSAAKRLIPIAAASLLDCVYPSCDTASVSVALISPPF